MVVGTIPEYLYDISRAGGKALHEMPIGHRISRHTQFSFVFGGRNGQTAYPMLTTAMIGG
jgi:hypothetical protein